MKPGPAAYSMTIDFKRAAPMFTIGKQERPNMARTKHQFSPGPAAYRNMQCEIGKNSPRKSISHKLEDIDKAKKDKLVPGPGQYNDIPT